MSFLNSNKTTTEGKTRGEASRLVESVEVVPDNLRIGVTNMRKLRGGNTEDDLSTGEFLLVDKGFHSLGVGASQWLGNSTFNHAQKVLPDEDCLHKEGPLMVIGFVKQSESGSFIRHGKRQWENDEN